MGLEHGGSGPCHFASFAPQIRGSTYLVKTPMGSRKLGRRRKGSLSGGLFGAIDIDDVEVAGPDDPTARLVERSEGFVRQDPLERALAMPRHLADPGLPESD